LPRSAQRGARRGERRSGRAPWRAAGPAASRRRGGRAQGGERAPCRAPGGHARLRGRARPRGAPHRAAAAMAPTSSSGGARAGVVHQRTLGEVNLHVALLALGAFAALRQMRRHHPLWLRRVDLDLWGREDAVVSTCMQGRGRWLRRVGLDLLDRERWLERNVLAAAVERGPVLFAHATEEELRTRRAIRCKWRATRVYCGAARSSGRGGALYSCQKATRGKTGCPTSRRRSFSPSSNSAAPTTGPRPRCDRQSFCCSAHRSSATGESAAP